MHAPTYPYAVRLIGFAPAESAHIGNALTQAPRAGPAYSCLLDDSLQEPDLYIVNGDERPALSCLDTTHPRTLQPAVIVGKNTPDLPYPHLARPLNRFQLFEVLAELVDGRKRALARSAGNGTSLVPERRRRPRLLPEPAEPLSYESRRQPLPDGALLIIDNEGIFRDHVAQLLGTHRMAVAWTDSAPTAVRLCEETPVSLVLINTSAAGIDPYALCSAIKSREGAVRTAVVFLVSRNFHYDSVRARDAGVRGLLDKPVADRHLMAALKKLLSLPA
jgi:CheY-like chemotaxis protein